MVVLIINILKKFNLLEAIVMAFMHPIITILLTEEAFWVEEKAIIGLFAKF